MNGLINKIKESIQAKLQLFILSSATIVFLATILYVTVKNRQMELEESIRLTKEVAQKRASNIQSELNKDFALTHTMAAAMQDFVLQSDSVRNNLVPTMLKRVFERNNHLQSLWIHWELSAVVPNYPFTYGRVRKTYFRKGNTIHFKIDTVDTDGDKENGLYYTIKTQKKNVITEPYWYSYSGDDKDEILETSVCVPVLQSTKFLGLMGIDIKLDRFEKLVGKIRPFRNSYAFFVSHKGTFVYHPIASNIGGNLITDNKKDNDMYRFDIRMKSGKPFSFRRQENGEELFVTFAPVFIGDTGTPWYLSIVVPYKEMTAIANQNMIRSFFIGFIGLLFLGIILYFIARNITRPLTRISNMLKELAAGKINTKTHLKVKTKDEIGSISHDVNGLKDSLGRTAMFATEIGKGNLDAEFEKLSDDDVIGKALLDMRESLREAKEEDLKRQRADEIQKWITNGIARINEIMRQHSELDQLAYAVVKYIVDALKANQGAFYVLTDAEAGVDIEDVTFEAVTALAWGRKKPLHRQIKMGETLIGRAAYEQTSLYMTEIPENYVNITSGLGKANPRSLLIVPLMLNEEVMGILEVISFHELEKYQIEFVEKAGESIASTIASVKISQRTARLLDQTKSQAGELTEKEEELRQQMEEMQATQEEASKRQAEMSGMITAINSIAYVAEYSMDGFITHVNEAYAQLLEMPQQQIVGKKQGFFQVGLDEDRREKFEQLWVKMRKGIPHKQEQKIEVNNKARWLSEVYTPINDMDGSPVRVINIAMDITHLKSNEE
jgi:methyl-accepting chemotaxis protein